MNFATFASKKAGKCGRIDVARSACRDGRSSQQID
jgi:hypothetical protein